MKRCYNIIKTEYVRDIYYTIEEDEVNQVSDSMIHTVECEITYHVAGKVWDQICDELDYTIGVEEIQ